MQWAPLGVVWFPAARIKGGRSGYPLGGGGGTGGRSGCWVPSRLSPCNHMTLICRRLGHPRHDCGLTAPQRCDLPGAVSGSTTSWFLVRECERRDARRVARPKSVSPAGTEHDTPTWLVAKRRCAVVAVAGFYVQLHFRVWAARARRWFPFPTKVRHNGVRRVVDD